MKNLALVLILCPLSPINAMTRFIARNSTADVVTLHKITLQPDEQKDYALPCGEIITIKSSKKDVAPVTTSVGWYTKLLDITTQKPEPNVVLYLRNPNDDDDNEPCSSMLVATQRTTRPLVIIKTYPSPLLITEKNHTLILPNKIACHDINNVSADIAANTQEVEIQHAQPAEAYPHNTPNERIKLVPTQNSRPILVALAKDATGLKICPERTSYGFGLKVIQLKHIEIEEEKQN